MKKNLLIPSLLAAAAVSANGALVGYWNFDNSDLDESSGFKADGTHDGEIFGTGVGYAAGPAGFGTAVTFSGSGAVRVLNSNLKPEADGSQPNNPTYQATYDADVAAGPLTVAAWVKGTPGQWSPYISHNGEGCCGYQLRRHSNNQGTTFTLRGTAGAPDPQGTIDPFDGGWHHVVGVFDSANSNRYIYVDGVLDPGSITDGSDTGSISAGTYEYLMFGGRNNGANDFQAYLTGSIDEVRIYNEALSQAEVQALMVPIPEPGAFSLAGLAGLMLMLRRRR